MNRRPKALPICLAVAAAILFGPAQVNIAFGQEAQLEEIVVTARKREEALQDIPLAITAFTSEELQKRSIQNMRDIALFTPGFNFEDFGGSGGTTPVVRGTTQVSILQSGEQNVSVFFDGVYLPRSYVTDLGFANMERVEVVKGPQSARYGRNAFMGAINYIPRRPGDEWDLQGQVVAGNHSRYDWADMSARWPACRCALRLATTWSSTFPITTTTSTGNTGPRTSSPSWARTATI